MPFKVFLSYGTDPDSRVTALRLQTLGTSYGIDVLVPHRNGAHSSLVTNKTALAEIQSAIDGSDCVIAIVTRQSGQQVEKELNYALQKHKVILPIVQPGAVSQDFIDKFPQTVQLSPFKEPDQLSNIMEYLKHRRTLVSACAKPCKFSPLLRIV